VLKGFVLCSFCEPRAKGLNAAEAGAPNFAGVDVDVEGRNGFIVAREDDLDVTLSFSTGWSLLK
jgi:hypothetical protein